MERDRPFVCRVPTEEEICRKWDYEISHNEESRENWVVWKKETLEPRKKPALEAFDDDSDIPF